MPKLEMGKLGLVTMRGGGFSVLRGNSEIAFNPSLLSNQVWIRDIIAMGLGIQPRQAVRSHRSDMDNPMQASQRILEECC